MNDIVASRRPKRPALTNPLKAIKPVSARSPQPASAAGKPVDLPSPVAPSDDGLSIKQPKKSRLKWVWIGLLIFVLLLAAAAGTAYWWYSDNLQARSDNSQHIRVVIESGDTADTAANKLEQNGVIRSSLAAIVYMKLNNKTNIKSGSYLFAANQTPQEIIDWLNDGRVDTFKVTIIPGQTLVKIKKGLKTAGYQEAAIDAALAKPYEHTLFADKPAGTSLEGYIFPDTYFVTSDTTVEQLLALSFDHFEKQLEKNDTLNQLAALGFNAYQGITLASIIEKEVSGDSDRRQVAQVFEKRLKENIVLGSDVTYHYGASLLGVDPSPDLNSPYNTRKIAGLPPGPIANFNLSALDAVVHPASGSYLYFVAGDDGNTYFAYTLAEHEANISKHCHKLCASN